MDSRVEILKHCKFNALFRKVYIIEAMEHSKNRQTVSGFHHIYAQNFTCAGQISACLRLKREATLSTLSAVVQMDATTYNPQQCCEFLAKNVASVYIRLNV